MPGRMALCETSSQFCVGSVHLSPELVVRWLVEKVVSAGRSPSRSAVSHVKLLPPLQTLKLRM